MWVEGGIWVTLSIIFFKSPVAALLTVCRLTDESRRFNNTYYDNTNYDNTYYGNTYYYMTIHIMAIHIII